MDLVTKQVKVCVLEENSVGTAKLIDSSDLEKTSSVTNPSKCMCIDLATKLRRISTYAYLHLLLPDLQGQTIFAGVTYTSRG